MKHSKILYRGRTFSDSSISNWGKFLKLWQSFETQSCLHYRLSSINADTLISFQTFCDGRNYTDTTRCLYSSLLKAALNSAISDGLLPNNRLELSQLKTKPDTSGSEHVYLTVQEIRKIELLELQEFCTDSKVRDIFLLGCYTGQRFSDYSTISRKDISTIDIGGTDYSVIKVRQKKTGVHVLVPVLFPKIIEILDKWGGTLPKISLSTFDHHIKGICKMAGIQTEIVSEKKVGNVMVKSINPKYKLITSHTARRTCITLLHLDGRLTSEQIRSISGHKTEAAFVKYLCQSEEDEVKSIITTLGINHRQVTAGNLRGFCTEYQGDGYCH